MCAVGAGMDGPASPVECAVCDGGDLWWEGRVDVQDCIWHQAQTKVAEEYDLVGAAMASQEGKCWVGATIRTVIVFELFGELEPRATDVRSLGVLLVGIGRTTGWGHLVGDYGEDGVGHSGTVGGLFRCVLVVAMGQ